MWLSGKGLDKKPRYLDTLGSGQENSLVKSQCALLEHGPLGQMMSLGAFLKSYMTCILTFWVCKGNLPISPVVGLLVTLFPKLAGQVSVSYGSSCPLEWPGTLKILFCSPLCPAPPNWSTFMGVPAPRDGKQLLPVLGTWA